MSSLPGGVVGANSSPSNSPTVFSNGTTVSSGDEGPRTRSKVTSPIITTPKRRVHYSGQSDGDEVTIRQRTASIVNSEDDAERSTSPSRYSRSFNSRTSPRHYSSYSSRKFNSSVSSGYFTADSEDENFVRDFDNYEVKDITLEFFYKPHSLTLLAVSLTILFAVSWYRDDSNEVLNLSRGFITMGSFFVLGLSILVFPNGPFVRPHPAIWRIVFGASMLYLCALVFMVNLTKRQIQGIINYFDSSIDFNHLDEKEYAVDCWNLRWDAIKGRLDVFVLAHFLGYVSKAVMMRSSALCWTISIMWEITEMLFMHVLPNFEECLWDQLILDVVLCNGFGIFIGMRVCTLLEMGEYNWESIKYINSASGKMKRALFQFTPMSWTRVQWFDTPSTRRPNSKYSRSVSPVKRSHYSATSYSNNENGNGGVNGAGNGDESYGTRLSQMARDPQYVWNRIMLVFIILLLCQITELNCFCLKHIFRIPTEHVFNWGRLVLLGFCVCPTVRQYYTYTTDVRCNRLGTQAWVFIAITAVELFGVARFGWDEIFAVVRPLHVVYWLALQLLAAIMCVYSMILYNKYFLVTLSKTKSKLKKLRSK